MSSSDEDDEAEEEEEEEEDDEIVVSETLVEGECNCLDAAGARALELVSWRCRFWCVRRRGGNSGGTTKSSLPELESESDSESEELEVEDTEEREASRVEELVWVSEELAERVLLRRG